MHISGEPDHRRKYIWKLTETGYALMEIAIRKADKSNMDEPAQVTATEHIFPTNQQPVLVSYQ